MDIKIFLIMAIMAFGTYSNAQVKTKKETKQERKKLKKLIQEELTMVTRYSHQPTYYLQVDKSGCRIVVKVDDIPLVGQFTEDRDQFEHFLINNLLLGSGEHVLSVDIYPLTTKQTLSSDIRIELDIIQYPEANSGLLEGEIIAELNVPDDIGEQKLPVYCDSLRFKATLPFDYKYVLNTAKDLSKVPNLEDKVLAYYNKVRDMMIAGDIYKYYKMRLNGTWMSTDMNYLTEKDLELFYFSSNSMFRFDWDHLTNWEIAPIENYEMVICGKDKLVYLQRIGTIMDGVLRNTWTDINEYWKYVSVRSIVLYMPKDSNELMELY